MEMEGSTGISPEYYDVAGEVDLSLLAYLPQAESFFSEKHYTPSSLELMQACAMYAAQQNDEQLRAFNFVNAEGNVSAEMYLNTAGYEAPSFSMQSTTVDFMKLAAEQKLAEVVETVRTMTAKVKELIASVKAGLPAITSRERLAEALRLAVTNSLPAELLREIRNMMTLQSAIPANA